MTKMSEVAIAGSSSPLLDHLARTVATPRRSSPPRRGRRRTRRPRCRRCRAPSTSVMASLKPKPPRWPRRCTAISSQTTRDRGQVLDQQRAEPRALVAQRREMRTRVARQALRRRGDGRREPRDQRHERRHEAERGAIGLAQIDVLGAGLGHRGAELGVAERAGQREHAADRPQQVDPAGMAEVGGLEAGGGEDAGADDVRHHQGGGAAQAKVTEQPAGQGVRSARRVYGWRSPSSISGPKTTGSIERFSTRSGVLTRSVSCWMGLPPTAATMRPLILSCSMSFGGMRSGAAVRRMASNGACVGPTLVAVADADEDVLVAELLEPRPRFLAARRADLDGVDLARQLRQHRGVIAAAGADLEHLLRAVELEQLDHARRHVGLEQRVAVRGRSRPARRRRPRDASRSGTKRCRGTVSMAWSSSD